MSSGGFSSGLADGTQMVAQQLLRDVVQLLAEPREHPVAAVPQEAYWQAAFAECANGANAQTATTAILQKVFSSIMAFLSYLI